MATKKKPTTKLSEAEFWKILGKLNWKKSGDDDAVMAPAIKALSQKSAREIEAFYELFAVKLHALDTREHCRHSYAGEQDPDDGDVYISADDFLYLRCCALLNGKKYYDTALKNPAKMPTNLEFEALLYLAPKAWELKTGEEFEYANKVDFESFSNKAGWAKNRNTRGGRFTGKNVPPGNRRPS